MEKLKKLYDGDFGKRYLQFGLVVGLIMGALALRGGDLVGVILGGVIFAVNSLALKVRSMEAED
jgi:hypothetical protein